MSHNATEAAQAWDSVDAGHGLVAVDRQWAAAQHLPSTLEHPRHTDKVVYIIEAYHHIHCLVSPQTHRPKHPSCFFNPPRKLTSGLLPQKCIHEHYLALAAGKQPSWSWEHDMHCLDTLRQHIMCMADDTLLYTTGHRDAGVNQTRMCRDWDALRRWAAEHTACYHDSRPHSGEPRWGVCDGGVDGLPVGSILE